MRKPIVGVTVVTPTSPRKIENEIKPVKTVNGVSPDENGNVEVEGGNGVIGENGATFTPSVSADGVLSWTNDKGLDNPESVGINGKDGKDGYTPQKGVDYFTEADKAEWSEYIAFELAKRGQLKPEFANSVEECTDITKLYVLPDGYIWAYMIVEVITGGYTNQAEPLPSNTTDTSKWVNGYRITSSAISEQAGTTVSNSIVCKEGDTIRIKGVSLRSNTDRFQVAYTKADGSKAYEYNYWNATGNLFSCVESNGMYVVTMKERADYTTTALRFAMPTPADANSVIITVNEEIVEPVIVKEYAWENTNHAFVPNDYDEEFVEINEKINRLELDVANVENANAEMGERIEALQTKIENIGTTEIPDYWKNHLAEKIATIKNLHKQYGKDCFSFVVLADTHYPANLGKISPLLARKIMDEADIRYALHCGDWQTRSCHKTKEALLEENEKIEAMFAPIRDRLLMQQGNHEGAYGLFDRDGDGEYINKDENGNNKPPAERESYVHNVTPQEMYEFLYRKVGMIGNVHFDDTGKAYYIDDISNNVRYIGLNTQCNDYELQADGTQKYPTMWIMRFSKAQFDFLVNEALVENVTNRTKIVIFGHVPLTQEIIERELMIGVLKAFKNKTAYSGSCAGEYGYDAVSVNADFTNAKGTLVGYFHGHIHSDSLDTTKGFNIIGTRSDAKEEYTEEMRNERVAGTVTEQSFNVFTVTPSTIYATKIGAGTDREISY